MYPLCFYKNTMKPKLLFLYILLNCIVTQTWSTENACFQIIPQPQQIKRLPGDGWNYNELKFVLADKYISLPPLGGILEGLQNKKTKGKGLELSLVETNVPDSEEGYVLEINEKGVHIQSRSEKGLFYGCQTLKQLLEDGRDFNQPIPCMRITDYPAIAFRAVHLDTKHHLDRMEYYYRMVDKLAYYKINAIIWELEDKLRYTRHPEISSPYAISKQEMQALCRYAHERHVEISPLVQGLGHASFILKHHWELRENPQSDWEFCPSNPQTYEFLFDLYQDAIEAMPYGNYLHIGGDEITAIGIDARCKRTGKTAFELQMHWLKKVCDFVNRQGRTPIFWDDMPLKFGNVWNTINQPTENDSLQWNVDKLDKAIELFPKNCVYMRWNYGDATGLYHQKLLQWYADKGLQVMAATAASAGDSPFLPRNDSRSNYIKGFCEVAKKFHINGILATAWDDGSPHLETVWRGYIAQAEFAWNPNGRTTETFKQAHSQREFGFNAKSSSMSFLEELEKAFFFFDNALVVSGRRNPAWGTTDFELIKLPNEVDKDTWKSLYKEKIIHAKQEHNRYKIIRNEIQNALHNARRNRYTLEIYQQLNELQHFPTQLILKFDEYSSAHNDNQRNCRKEELKDLCRSFLKMRYALENVYSHTRFIEQPAGYIPDMNHHNHLAAKTENFDWMHLYELSMIKKVQTWLQK